MVAVIVGESVPMLSVFNVQSSKPPPMNSNVLGWVAVPYV